MRRFQQPKTEKTQPKEGKWANLEKAEARKAIYTVHQFDSRWACSVF